ncbi:uncharacterized protein GIQ15_02344 [Arthroderma uncinatum]|uniref:uncharacterized protein n=1 Tax=Arthroderma uncinatum TaxID=74035 RepID=UPI00144A984F|nr:uncharacterized protein GIQ15_02344 [Arthroderma uncinatum]KAF3483020.1 hypothetical protein GIQ15_02344 [Arthroderma uncinatum]
MGIHEDARQGTLLGSKLADYIKSNPNIINEQDPEGGLTPLAAATVGGYTEVIKQLLKKGAKVEVLSRDGETPLLLAAWKLNNNRARIIQLLLKETPPDVVDTTCSAAENNTPLIFAVMKRDVESIRLLRRAGASETIPNKDGISAEEMAKNAKEEAEENEDRNEEEKAKAVIRALSPEMEKEGLAKITSMVVSFLNFVVAWVNNTAKGVVRLLYGLDPELDEDLNKALNGPEKPSKAKFVKNVDKFIKDTPLERFFKKKKTYIQELAQKGVELENDKSTPLGNKDLLPKTIKVSLHQQVIYCDDSSSMKREGRWESQKSLVDRITRVTTKILPKGEGVALRFINQDVDDSPNLTQEKITEILKPMKWAPNGNTEIGTYLKSKILEPMVYSKLEPKSFDKPLLISVITDGMPSVEADSVFADAILECGNKLEDAGYPRESVKFLVGQIGTGAQAAAFLERVRKNERIKDLVFCTSDQLDARLKEFRDNEWDLDRWLIETLFEPLKDREIKKDQ